MRHFSYFSLLFGMLIAHGASAQERPRDLGIPFGNLQTGNFNAITDVPGVRVGQVTLVKGKKVRTGV
ncbi:MAG: P1 family peptidase, partial [Bacteroidota bacterium]